MNQLISLLAAALICLAACKSTKNDPVKLGPVPEDLRVRLHRDGGMSPLGLSWKIATDSSYIEAMYRGTKRRNSFASDSASLHNFWKDIMSQNPENIKVNREEEVYDRGGYSFSIDFGETEIDKSDSGLDFVERGSSSEAFSHIVKAIQEFVADGLADQRAALNISLEYEGLDSVEYVSVQFNETSLFYRGGKETFPVKDTTLTWDPLPGPYHLHATVRLNGVNKYISEVVNIVPGRSHWIFHITENGPELRNE